MKKPSSFAHQIQQARRTIESWPDSRLSTLRLEGFDVFLTRRSSDQSSRQQCEVSDLKEKSVPDHC